MSTTWISVRSRTSLGKCFSISTRNSSRCAVRSSPDKQSRIPPLSGMRSILSVTVAFPILRVGLQGRGQLNRLENLEVCARGDLENSIISEKSENALGWGPPDGIPRKCAGSLPRLETILVYSKAIYLRIQRGNRDPESLRRAGWAR